MQDVSTTQARRGETALTSRGTSAINLDEHMARHEPSSRDAESVSIDAFVDAIHRHRSRYLWIAASITHNEQEAEDVLQEALLKAFRRLSTFRGESQMATWLHAIVRNAALEYERNNRVARSMLSLDSSPVSSERENIDVPDPTMPPDDLCHLQQQHRLAVAAMAALHITNRRVFEMCAFEEMPQHEVAARLDISIPTIKSRLFRARLALRRALSQGTTDIGAIAEMEQL